ncbi:hypothetical protein Lesp01_89390 [Lentzea sp. NBRC 102530]|nr:hypothetical protein Lesp01_89390 [Lentzea sp. NBRC 102530]
MRVANLAQRVRARDFDGIRLLTGSEQPRTLLPAHAHLLWQVFFAGHEVLLRLLTHAEKGTDTRERKANRIPDAERRRDADG